MKLSALYKRLVQSIPGRPKPKKKGKEEDEEAEQAMNRYQAHLKEVEGTMPDRGPSEFGNMGMYSNLDKSI